MARLVYAALALALMAAGSSCASTPGVSRGVTHPSPRVWSFASVDRPLSSEVVRDGDAWRISSDRGRTIALFALEDVGTEPGFLTYRAFLKASGIEGGAYLQIAVTLDSGEQRVGNGSRRAVVGTTDWAGYEVGVPLGRDERVARVQLDAVLDGSGTLRVRDVELRLQPIGD